MTRFNRIAAALFAAGALSIGTSAMAQEISYPRVVGTGENATVEYGPDAQQNIVGGGRVTLRNEPNGTLHISHLDANYAQPGRQGLRAVTVGQGESVQTVWLPADSNISQALVTGRYNRG